MTDSSEIKSLPISLQQSDPTSNGDKHTQAQKANTALKQRRRFKGKVLAALCTHLGINIGVKGPTAFELFMVYRALGGRNRR